MVMIEILIALIAAAFALWAMFSVANSSLSKSEKLLWFAITILIPIVGPVIYFYWQEKMR
jgi:hypothetical protein